MPERIGFLGIGRMGQPMAANLVRKGFDVAAVVHRRREPVQALEALGVRIAPSLAALVGEATVVVACLPGSAEVEAAVLGPGGVLENGQTGGAFIDMGTSKPASTRMLAARLRDRGIAMLDAPITGGVRGAREATLTIYVGGASGDLNRVRPVLEAMGERVIHMGGPGAGHVTKLLNNALFLSSMALLAELLPLGVRAGLDPQRMIEALGAGTGASMQIPGRGGRILKRQFDAAFQLALAHKDLRLAQELAQEHNLPTPVAAAAYLSYTLARGLGLDAEDAVAVVKVFERLAGVEVAGSSPPPGAPRS